MGNASDGVLINFGSANNTIGGTTPAARNLISGNGGNGVRSDYHPNVVQGNFIGTQVDGVSPLGNGSNGVLINFTVDNVIGGSASGAGNTIAFNGGAGVLVMGASSPVSSNAVFANSGLGIDLDGDGVTPNDPCDGDSGANNRQNFPVITSSSSSGGSTTIQGTLDSAANMTFRIEFFSTSASDPSGFGEGEKFIGSAMVMTDGVCQASFATTSADRDPFGQLHHGDRDRPERQHLGVRPMLALGRCRGDTHSDSNDNRHSGSDADTHSYSGTNCHSGSDADTYPDSSANCYSSRNADTYSNSSANCYSKSNIGSADAGHQSLDSDVRSDGR